MHRSHPLVRIGFIALLLAAGASAIIACVDGTTPDCSGPEAGCAPDLDGSLDELPPPGRDASTDAQDGKADDAAADATDETDAPKDGPVDAALDGDARG